MLSGVLLHVVAAACGIDLAVDAGSGLEGFSLRIVQRGFEVVHDSAVFRVGDFGDSEFGVCVRSDPSGVEYLAAAGGIEGGAVENERRARGVEDFADFGVEVVEERIVVVEACGHGEDTILTTEDTEDTEGTERRSLR